MKENWTYKKLGEVCELEYGTRVVQARDGGSIYPVYGGGGATFKMDLYNRENRVVVSRFAMSTKCTRKVNGKFFLNDSGLTIKSVDVTLSQIYLDTCILALNDKIYSLGRGAAQKNLKVTDLVNIPIPIPPMEEQERIVAELDLLQSVIDKKKAQLDEYDKLAQSIFYEMFGDPIDNPKKWEVKKLGDECSEIRYGTSKPACENGKYKYLRMGNITNDGFLDLSNIKTIDIPDDEVEKCVVRYGDILFNRTNSLDLIGKTCMFDLEEPMIIAGYIIRVRLSKKLMPRYVSTMFNIPSMKLHLKKMAKGAVNQANINSKELASIIIPLPPLSLQQSFAEKIEAIEHQKELVKQSLNEVKTLFDSRMDYYFN